MSWEGKEDPGWLSPALMVPEATGHVGAAVPGVGVSMPLTFLVLLSGLSVLNLVLVSATAFSLLRLLA